MELDAESELSDNLRHGAVPSLQRRFDFNDNSEDPGVTVKWSADVLSPCVSKYPIAPSRIRAV